jgi:hypothetical protein
MIFVSQKVPEALMCLEASSLTPPSPISRVEGEPSDVHGFYMRRRAITGLGLPWEGMEKASDRELTGVVGS